MDDTDRMIHAMDVAAARARHGVPTGPPCIDEGCGAPSLGRSAGHGHDNPWCDQHSRETDRMLDATWPPVIEGSPRHTPPRNAQIWAPGELRARLDRKRTTE